MTLSDTQLVILQSGARDPERLCRADRKLGQAPRQAIAKKLLAAGLVEIAGPWRTTHAPELRFGDNILRITDAGLRAIGVGPDEEPIPPYDSEEARAMQRAAIVESEIEAEEAPAKPDRKAAERVAKQAARAEDYARRAAEADAEARSGRGFWRAAAEAAARGELPPAPDFSAPTHAPYRKKLQRLIELAQAGDADGLRAVALNPTSTSPKTLIRWRDLAVRAIEAREPGR